MHGVGPEVGGDADGADEEVGAAGAVLRVRVEQGGTVLATRVEHVAGARLHGDAQTEGVQPRGDPAGAGGEAVGERVEMHVVERQADAVVPQVGKEGECVVETEVGEAVGAVPEAERGRSAIVHGPVRSAERGHGTAVHGPFRSVDPPPFRSGVGPLNRSVVRPLARSVVRRPLKRPGVRPLNRSGVRPLYRSGVRLIRRSVLGPPGRSELRLLVLAPLRTPARPLVRLPAHVMLTFLIAALFANHRPAGARAAIVRDAAPAPERAASAAWRGIVARMPPPTARWVSGGEGLSTAWK